MTVKQRFREAELEQIKAAVKEAEDKISGEIVPVIVDQSDNYAVAHYKSALFFGAFIFSLIVILDRYAFTSASNTLYYDPMFIFCAVAVASIAGYYLPNLSTALKRFFLSQRYMDECTRQKAEAAFLEEEVFNTRHRTGIMIFISFFEHEVIVMADTGINKVVEQKEWDKIVQDLISHIREGRITDGIAAGVKRCGEILLEKGFLKTHDDTNELRDDLRIN